MVPVAVVVMVVHAVALGNHDSAYSNILLYVLLTPSIDS